jgi:hypothetical protein
MVYCTNRLSRDRRGPIGDQWIDSADRIPFSRPTRRLWATRTECNGPSMSCCQSSKKLLQRQKGWRGIAPAIRRIAAVEESSPLISVFASRAGIQRSPAVAQQVLGKIYASSALGCAAWSVGCFLSGVTATYAPLRVSRPSVCM